MRAFSSLATAITALFLLLALALTSAAASPDCAGDPVSAQAVALQTAAASTDCTGDPVSDRRIALVIGISGYGAQDKVSGVKDAKDVACYLQQLGFTIVGPAPDRPGPLLDESITAIMKALKQFENGVPQADVALFYFSGHGFQQDKENYLLPAGSSFTREDLLALRQVISSLSVARTGTTKIVLLDACRNNQHVIVDGKPLRETSGWRPGMAKVQDASFGGVIGFATLYDQSAESGPADGNSPYTLALLAHLRDPGLEFHRLLTRVRENVAQATCGRQAPWEEGSIGSFALRKAATINARIEYADDDLVVATTDGRDLLSWGDSQGKMIPVTLQAGDNPIELRVYNQKTYRNHHAWEPPEGWRYSFKLTAEDGVTPLRTAPGASAVFSGGEPYVFKDGPHHGKWFKVATATINVSAEGKVKVAVVSQDLDVWRREKPEYATDQRILCGVSLASLSLFNVQHQVELLIGGRHGLEEQARRCASQGLWDPNLGRPAKLLLLGDFLNYLKSDGASGGQSQQLGPIAGCVSQPIWFAIDDRVDGHYAGITECSP
jgi:hypothetical protein